jgi:TRAP-type C4-dicarboxylate transport system permease large subunit
MLPFLGVMILALALITLFPDLVLFLPRLFGYRG